jgi:DNA-directed RNA polymerase subunit RPC12/RpoP
MAEVKIKCRCGKKFNVSESDAIRRESDFDGQDDYVFECPSCGARHFIWTREFKKTKKSFWD